MNYKSCWITLNRNCNLRCKWCYAKDTNYLTSDDMNIENVFEIVDLCSELKLKHITLIGGEPTIYPHLIDVIKYIHDKKISCGFVSNGLKYSDEKYVKKLMNCGIKNFSISLKGENRETFKEITGKDAFEQVIDGIKNCIKNNAKVSVSMVLTEENIESYLAGIKTMKDIGVNNFQLSFCYEFNTNSDYNSYLKNNNPKKLIDKFREGYHELDKITEHKFRIAQSFPMCLWDKEFIELLASRNQITSICQLLGKTGLLFDTELNIIPCNAMYKLKLGRLHEDFNTAYELIKHTQKKEFRAVYDKLCGVPDEKCLSCSDLKYCGGGCVCQWTNYSFEQLTNI